MIKWARAKMLHGWTAVRQTGHIFMFNNNQIGFYNLRKDEYPPFDCVSLCREDAIKLRDFLTECLNYGEIND